MLTVIVWSSVAQIRMLNTEIAQLERELRTALSTHPKAGLLETLPRVDRRVIGHRLSRRYSLYKEGIADYSCGSPLVFQPCQRREATQMTAPLGWLLRRMTHR